MEDELENFVKIFKRHVFDSKSSMATIAECVSTVSKHCAEVSNVFTCICLHKCSQTRKATINTIIIDSKYMVTIIILLSDLFFPEF